jgi:hypothetical protein
MRMAPEARPVPFITENTPRLAFWRPAVFEPGLPFEASLLDSGQLAGGCDLPAMRHVLDSLVVQLTACGMVWIVGSIGHVASSPMISVLVLGYTSSPAALMPLPGMGTLSRQDASESHSGARW